MKKKIVLIALVATMAFAATACSGGAETQETTVTETTVVETTAEPTIEATTAIEYELDIENTLKNITYFTPSEFDTKGTSGLIFNHKSPDNDNLLVSYTELGENIALYTESQANELLDGTVEGAKGNRDDFELYNKKYLEIASCYGIDFSYKMEGIYVHNYSFLWKDGVYQFLYSSVNPLSDEDEKLLTEVIDSIMLQY